MKYTMILIAAMLLPATALASRQVDIGNSGGTLAGSASGLTLTGSTLTLVNNLYPLGLITGNLGTVVFSTAAMDSGTIQTGGTFAPGGSFTVTGNGTNGVVDGTIFTGSWTGEATWTLITLADGSHNYNLTGIVTGTVYTTYKSYSASGVTFQLTVNTGTGYFNGSTTLSSGNMNILCHPY
jgi:hypothetical protein